jgi:hypothetical protein
VRHVVAVAIGVIATTEQVIKRLGAIDGDLDLIGDVVLLQGAQRELHVVVPVFDQQDQRFRVHAFQLHLLR